MTAKILGIDLNRMNARSNDPRDPSGCDRLAGAWVRRGIVLMNRQTRESLEEALACFDESVALRRALPLAGNNWFRYGLTASWMNRGDALTRLGGKENLQEAVVSYDESLALLFGLPLDENPLFPRRLAIAWINRGFTLHQLKDEGWLAEAVQCYDEARQVLNDRAIAVVPDNRLLQAGSWMNTAGVWLDDPAGKSVPQAIHAARQAIGLSRAWEREDVTGAETGFKARHLLCRALAMSAEMAAFSGTDWITETTDTVDEALELARYWELKGGAQFRPAVREFFRFGCRVYQSYQPHFLNEFILESLDPEVTPGVPPPDRRLQAEALSALWSELKKIQRSGFSSVATPQFERVLARIRELRATEERLHALMA